MKKLIALICIFLVAMLPVAIAAEVQESRQVEEAQAKLKTAEEEARESRLGVKEANETFEDILVQVDSYQPRVLRAGLLEEQDVNIYAALIGAPTNPTLSIPRITNVDVRVRNVTWEPVRKPQPNVRGVRYVRPADGVIDYRDLGYLLITIGKIPKEHDVPDVINVDLDAKISFDISETLTVTKKDLSMPALAHDEWIKQIDEYGFFGGYLRAQDIGENNAVFFLYDRNRNLIPRPITITEGATSGVLSTTFGGAIVSGLERSYDRFRIRLNKIRGLENEAWFLVQKPESQIVNLVKGDRLYAESDWVVQDIKVGKDKDGKDGGSVILKNSVLGTVKTIDYKFEAAKVEKSKDEKEFDEALSKAKVNLITEPKNYLEDYANAVAMYENVIQEGNKPFSYGDYSGNLAADAQKNIYEIYKELGFVEKQIETGEILLKGYPDIKDANLIRDELNALGDRASVNDRTLTLQDAGGDVVVTLTKVYAAGELDKPKATLFVDGKEGEYGKDDTIPLEEGKLSLKVIGFENRLVRLQEIRDGKDGKTIRVSLTQQGVKGEREHSLQLKKLDFKRVAYVSILPEVKRAYSETDFSLHIPVERRQIGLPLFSSTIDKEINKTAKLIEKLDKYIDQMEKLHKFWTNLCLVTFATIWAKNLLSGVAGLSSGSVVRSKINSEWRQKYNNERASGYKGSFDQYVLNNSAEYNKDYDGTKQILDEIDAKGHERDPRTSGIKDKEFQKETFYSYHKAKDNPENDFYVKRYVGNSLRAREIKVDDNIENVQEKEWNSAKDSNQAKDFIDIMDNNPAFKGQRTELSGEQRYAALWNNEGTKEEILNAYRKEQIRKERENYFKADAENNYKADFNAVGANADDAKYKDYLNSLRTPETTKFAPETIAASDIVKRGDKYYVAGTDIEVTNVPADGKFEIDKTEVTINDEKVKVVSQAESAYKHNGKLQVYDAGREKGRLQRISIDAKKYAEVKYGTGGRIESIEIYERAVVNDPMGGKDDKRIGEAAELQARTDDPKLKGTLSQLYSCVGGVNNELARRELAKGNNVQFSSNIGCSLGKYVVSKAVPAESGPSCVDYMDPNDCRLLFNACDPVVCPPSRCNLDGTWQVSNVVETGIIGSTFLCLPNSVVLGGDVLMPICLTGILAGLKNIKSILQGYNQCLKTSKLEDRSVGICDRLRSYYLCEILWREASALLNTKEGVLGFLVNKVAGVSTGGGEYSKSTGAVNEAVDSIDFFTTNYAKGVFAGYAGAGFSEIGVEICKTAIFGKAPKIGDLLDSVSRPESPPQFTAFFDENPYSDIDRIPQSLYTVFYHIYAGENEDLTYSVFLRGTPVPGQVVLPPASVAANKKIKAGEYASENIEKVLPAGFSEICIITTTKSYGTKQECGPGRVTTEFALDWLSETYVKNQAQKRINNEKECVPDSLTILGEGKGVGIGAGAAATVSTGLTQTGIVRTCSQENPGLGVDKTNWARVGECGNDNLGRDLGRCWLYKPSVNYALQQQYSRETVEKGLFETSRRVEIEGLDKAKAASVIEREQTAIIINNVRSKSFEKIEEFKDAIVALKQVIEKSVDFDAVLFAKYELANLYKRRGLMSKEKAPKSEEQQKEAVSKPEGSDVNRLKDAYTISKKSNEKIWQLLQQVQLISRRAIVYGDAGAIRGLSVPDVDMKDVDSLDAFMSRLIGAVPEGSYAVEVTDTEIKITSELPMEGGTRTAEVKAVGEPRLADLVAFRSGSCTANEAEIFRIKEDENTLTDSWGGGAGNVKVSKDRPLLFCVDRSISYTFYVEASIPFGDKILRYGSVDVPSCDSWNEQVVQLVGDFDGWAETRIRGFMLEKKKLDKNEALSLCMAIGNKAYDLLQFRKSSKSDGPKCLQNAENRGYFLFDVAGDDYYGSSRVVNPASELDSTVSFDDNEDIVNLCVDKNAKP